GHHGMHRGFMRRDFDPTAHLEGRLAFLKTELQIKPAQESAWSDFASAARKSASILAQARPTQPEDRQGPPAMPERLDRAEQRMTAHREALKTVKAPAKKLYDGLDETQKKTADELAFAGPMGMMGPR